MEQSMGSMMINGFTPWHFVTWQFKITSLKRKIIQPNRPWSKVQSNVTVQNLGENAKGGPSDRSHAILLRSQRPTPKPEASHQPVTRGDHAVDGRNPATVHR